MSDKDDTINVRATGKGVGLVVTAVALIMTGGLVGTTVSGANDVKDSASDVANKLIETATRLIEQNEDFTKALIEQNATLVSEVKTINENLHRIGDKVDAMNMSQMQDREAISGMKERINSMEKTVDRLFERVDSNPLGHNP